VDHIFTDLNADLLIKA